MWILQGRQCRQTDPIVEGLCSAFWGGHPAKAMLPTFVHASMCLMCQGGLRLSCLGAVAGGSEPPKMTAVIVCWEAFTPWPRWLQTGLSVLILKGWVGTKGKMTRSRLTCKVAVNS